MAAAVNAELVAVLRHPFYDVRILLHPVAAQKEGGADVPLPQTVQKLRSDDTCRAVIKGQCRIFHVLCPGSGAQKQQWDQKKQGSSSVKLHFFCLLSDIMCRQTEKAFGSV